MDYKESSLKETTSGLQRLIQNYTKGYIIIYSPRIGTTMGYIGDM